MTRKQKRHERLKKLLSFVKSGKFIVSVLLAGALWSYVTLNNEYMAYVKLPINIILPSNRALEQSIPEEISVEVKGLGWNIINLWFFNTTAKCEVDLSNVVISQDDYKISRNDLLKSVQFLGNVEPLDIVPESIILRTGMVGAYKVPVIPAFVINPRKGFVVVGEPRLSPAFVTIKGNNKVVGNINYWPTAPISINDVFQPFRMPVPLADSLKGIVSLNNNIVNVSVDIQQKAEIEIHGVKLKVRGGALQNEHSLNPVSFVVTIQGPVGMVADMSKDNLVAYLNYNDVLNDSTGILIPNIEAPKSIKILNIKPRFVYHLKNIAALPSPEPF